MLKPKIALVTGGFSGEAKISYQSAKTIERNIDPEKFDHYKIDITVNSWFYQLPDGNKIEVDRNDFSLLINGQKINFDAVLIAIHGTPGEDGKLQGYFDMLQIPYTSCSCAISALTFNKRHTVAVASFGGIKVANSVLLFKNNYKNADELVKALRFPVFVKPNNGGSSIGMSKVNSPSEDLDTAIEKAFKEDEQVLVEEFIPGREFTIGVFQSKGKIMALPITEVITTNEFFDYEAKYLGASREITPAEVDGHIAKLITNEAIKIYQIFNCKGIVRIDFIYHEEKALPFMLEINTVPGQTEASLVPQQVKVMGWNLKDFYTALLEACLPDIIN